MIYIILLVFIAALAAFLYFENNCLSVSIFKFSSPKVPKEYNGFKILQVSDLQNKLFSKGQKRLIDRLKKLDFDILVITGDLIDRRKYNLAAAEEFIKNAVTLADVYYVPGNHEAWSGRYGEVKSMLLKYGVKILENITIELSGSGGEKSGPVFISGVMDPGFLTGQKEKTDVASFTGILNKLEKTDDFNILLTHRPELFELYHKFDLIFAGHAHGGQIRLPLIGGLFAPGQGLFPKYTSGMYSARGSTMFVSRGLGNSVFPFRIFNRPQLMVVELQATE